MSDVLPIKPPRHLYKYRSMQSARDRARVKDILLKHRLYFPTRLGFNDPFDCHVPISWDRSTPEEWRQKLLETYRLTQIPKRWAGNLENYVQYLLDKKHIIAQLHKSGPKAFEAGLNKFQVLCLCKRPDGILMWSHYASNHEGICLQFRTYDGSIFSAAVPVEYANDYPILKATLLRKELADGMIRTKAKLWKYEKEWRVFKNNGQTSHYTFPKDCLTGVILGCQTSAINQALISTWLQQRNSPVVLYKASKECDKFALRIKRIEKIG